MFNIMYFVFGTNLTNHAMVQFSFLTFLSKVKANTGKVIIVTDNPHLYRKYQDSIEVIPVSSELIMEWQGKHKFFWRAKIKAIDMVAQKYPTESLVYLDGDTFFYGDIDEMNTNLGQGKCMMHINEGHPSTMKTKTLRMWKRVKSRTYSNVTIGKQHDMWNAGVVAIPQKYLQTMPKLALEICDGMLDDGAEPIVIEQYSLSISAYEHGGLVPAAQYIGHYWGNKNQWQSIIDDFMLRMHMTNASINESIENVRSQVDFCSIPVYKHYSSWRNTLYKKIDQLFKNPKRVKYANQR